MCGNASTVLIVEDDPLIRFALEERLRRAGHRVREAATSWAAAEHLGVEGATRSRVDLVLLDANVPGDGFPFLEWLRARLPTTPIILMTADKTPELEAGAHARGVPLVVDKPFDLDVVSSLVGEALAQASVPPLGS